MAEYVELEVGAPAHGGHCIARLSGRVYFVRHALPGERVRAVVTEDRGSYCRADAVEVLSAAPGRVAPPCPHAGPGRCGGCDWQHADAATQRQLKAAVVHEQFRRLARLDVTGLLATAEALPGAGGLLGWRTRITFAVDAAGHPGLRRHRSHHVERVDSCPLGVPGVGDHAVLRERWSGLTGIEVARGDDGEIAVLGMRPEGGRQPGERASGKPRRQARGRRAPDRVELLEGPEQLRYRAGDREFTVAAGGFWQVHPAAASTLAAALLDQLAPRPGERVLDLYAGAGALTAPLAAAVGPTGRVVGVESARQAVADAAGNLADLPWAEVRHGRVEATRLTRLTDRPDLVVLDPPRAGAGREVMTAIVGLGARAVGYVACDPAALARDVGAAMAAGWRLTALRAFDAFPMTHHVECVARLEPDPCT